MDTGTVARRLARSWNGERPMTPFRAVCLATAFVGALAASASTVPPQIPTDYCKGLNMPDCLDKLTVSWERWKRTSGATGRCPCSRRT